MSSPDPPDVHAPYVQPLVDAGDWASLVRYWMAHQYERALDLAIDLVRHRARDGGSPWRELAAYLGDVRQDPISLEREPPEDDPGELGVEEQATLVLIDLYPRVALCEIALRFPVESQDNALRAGIAAADRACSLANNLREPSLFAFIRSMQARGYREFRDLEAARASYDEALAAYRALAERRPDVYRPGVAATLNNLGNVQRALNDLEAARASYVEALAVRRQLAERRPDVYRPDVAATLNNLGNVQGALNDLEAARASYDEAAHLYERGALRQPSAHLMERLGCWTNLGQLYLQNKPDLGWPDRHRARDAFRGAFACAEAFRGRFSDPLQKKRVQEESLGIYERLVEVCVDIWQIDRDSQALEEAVEVAEASRARRLMELLAEETLQPDNTPPELVEQFRQLRRTLKEAERRLQDETNRPDTPFGAHPSPPPEPDSPADPDTRSTTRHVSGNLPRLQREVEGILPDYNRILKHVQTYDKEFNPDKPVPSIGIERIRSLIPDDLPTAVIHYTITANRGVVLVLTVGGIQSVPLPDMDSSRAIDLANSWYRAYYETCREQGGRLDYEAWSRRIEELLTPIATRAVQPVIDALPDAGIKRLMLVPNRVLHLFPLHACTLEHGHYLADDFEVIYTPSLSILHRCAERRRPSPRRLLTVENPTLDLAFPEFEAAAVGRHFSAHTRKQGPDARREWLLDHPADCDVWHYTGHSMFNPADPLASGLILESSHTPDRWLTLRDIFTGLRLNETTLATLSGCESGGLRPDQIDEYVGLPSGFLFAGATCVVSSLWAVHDLATALLMDRFYEEWRVRKRGVGAALREAQRWLREDIVSGEYLRDQVVTEGFLARVDDPKKREDCRVVANAMARKHPETPPFASPAFWAAFTATGWTLPFPYSAKDSSPPPDPNLSKGPSQD